MKWNEFRVFTTGEACEAVAEMLTAAGAKGCEVIEPSIDTEGCCGDAMNEKMLLPSRAADNVIIKAWFPDSDDTDIVMGKIQAGLSVISKYLKTGPGNISISSIEDEDWANNWKQYYKPFRISEHFIVKPSWENIPEDLPDNTMIVDMDPGMAFGTGTHETTAMCACLIDEYMAILRQVTPDAAITAADAGCGSGILAIIAALSGASHVTAFDTDPLAVKIAEDNCGRNGVGDRVEVLEGDISVLKSRYNIIAANIIADVIISTIPQIPKFLKNGGIFIASGIIKSRAPEVLAAAQDNGLTVERTETRGEWVAMVMTVAMPDALSAAKASGK